MTLMRRADEGEQYGPRDVWVCDCGALHNFTMKQQGTDWGRGFDSVCEECGTSRWFAHGRVMHIERPNER